MLIPFPLSLAPLARLVEEIGQDLSGKSVVPFERMREFNRRFRLLGWQGLVGMAVAGLDMAIWDALGKEADWPVVRLLGGEPRAIMAYDSYGALDLKTDKSALSRSRGRWKVASEALRSSLGTVILRRTWRPSLRSEN
jgi:mandelate racemase